MGSQWERALAQAPRGSVVGMSAFSGTGLPTATTTSGSFSGSGVASTGGFSVPGKSDIGSAVNSGINTGSVGPEPALSAHSGWVCRDFHKAGGDVRR